jgi:hypothetical protein
VKRSDSAIIFIVFPFDFGFAKTASICNMQTRKEIPWTIFLANVHAAAIAVAAVAASGGCDQISAILPARSCFPNALT